MLTSYLMGVCFFPPQRTHRNRLAQGGWVGGDPCLTQLHLCMGSLRLRDRKGNTGRKRSEKGERRQSRNMMCGTGSRATGHRAQLGSAQGHWDGEWAMPASSRAMSAWTVHVWLIGTKVPELPQPCRVPFSKSENLGLLLWSRFLGHLPLQHTY